ncbi:MAG: hypothetical protein ABI806_23700 [Candidatus Solibacter sp.]
MWFRILLLPAVLTALLAAPSAPRRDYQQRVDEVRRMPGFVALWDFVKRDPATLRFDAYKAPGERHDFQLDAVNYVRDYWNEGRAATYADFPLLGSGPFGQAIQIKNETDREFRPCLLVPRSRLHDSAIDVKGRGRSVSMVAWLIRDSGNHAIAGIWHEGTDVSSATAPASRVEHGMRQYALFAGLAANNGGAAAHVSENGGSSFGDRYARNLAVTPEVIPAAPAWVAVGFAFDDRKHTVTAYLDGTAHDYWIEYPERHAFFQWPYKGWVQAQLRRMPGRQEGEDPAFPADQFYEPPEGKPLSRTVLEQRSAERVELHVYAFTKVRVTLRKDPNGRFTIVTKRELAALRANPFWFAHDLYAPPTMKDGGPFTIGRVIHSSRSVGFTGYIGGVAVFDRAISPRQMQRLAAIAHNQPLTTAR